jgi:hypothetical protein
MAQKHIRSTYADAVVESNWRDRNTNEIISYTVVSNFWDETPMDDSKCDGVIYRKKSNGEYLRRNFTGEIEAEIFGIKATSSICQREKFNNAIAVLGSLGGGSLKVSKGIYRIDAGDDGRGIIIESDNIKLDFEPGSVLYSPDEDDLMSTLDRAVIDIGGLRTEKTTLIGTSESIAQRVNTITMNTVEGLTSGDMIIINSDDYLSGADGVAGFGLTNKSEILKVVSISGNTITVDQPTQDFYQTGVKIYRIEYIKNIAIRNVEIIGGGTKPIEIVPDNGRGQNGIRVNYFENVTLNNITVRDCQNAGIRTSLGRDVYGDNLRFYAPVGANLGYYGFMNGGVDNCQIVNITGRNVRHVFDTAYSSPTSFLPHSVARNFTVTNAFASNTYVAAFSTHPVVNAVFTNLQCVNCNSGFIFRGKNLIISDCILKGKRSTGGVGVSIGGNTQNAGTAATDSGEIVISNILCEGFSRPMGVYTGIAYLSVCQSKFKAYNNTTPIYINSPYIGVLKIDDNVLDCTAHTAFAQGIHIDTFAHGNMKIDYVQVSKNEIIDPFFDGIRVQGYSVPESTGIFSIENNKVVLVSKTKIGRLVRFTGGDVNEQIILNNAILGGDAYDSPSSSVVVDPIAAGTNKPVVGAIDTGNYSLNWRYDIEFAASQANGVTQLPGMITKSTTVLTPGINRSQIVTEAGTAGTLNAGATTASITAESDILVVNSVTGLKKGYYISVAGAGAGGSDHISRIVSVSGLNVTLAVEAVTSVTDAAVSYHAPKTIPSYPQGSSQPAINNTGTDLSKVTLNSLYPSQIRGFEVICPTIEKIYKKLTSTDNGDWSESTITII